jgi:undecaprenyl-diphosphatase
LITLTAATALAALKDGSTVIDTYGVGAPLIGIIAAGVSAFVAVRTFVAFLKQRELTVFGWYRIAIGVLIVGLLAFSDVF